MFDDATNPVALDAGRLVGLLADDDRRRMFAAVELGGTTLDAAATLAGLPAFAASGTGRQKRLFVLDWLAQEFEPGRRYSEPMVNLILGKRHADTAALRRYLVDEGLLDRGGGEYWRTGGTVELDPSQSATIRTHYEVLGVPVDADASTIRAAYRDRARVHHPDRSGGASTFEMTAINEAYRVLGDDSLRVTYDLHMAVAGPFDATSPIGSTAASPTITTSRRPAPGPPARMPWKMMGGIAAIGIAVVLIGSALREPAAERPPDGVVGPGSCVAIDVNNDAREVNCRGDGDLVVEVVVAFDSPCPNGTEPHRDRQGLGIACVIPITAP